jgi:hypothetical protein
LYRIERNTGPYGFCDKRCHVNLYTESPEDSAQPQLLHELEALKQRAAERERSKLAGS